MARHKAFDETEALGAAMHTFWAKGYEGTSLQDLEAATGLTRTSIYNAFGNKRDLFEKAVIHYQQTELGRLVLLLDGGESIQEGVKKMLMGALDLHYREDTPGGCLVVLSLLEREQHNAGSIQLLETILQGIQKSLRDRMSVAQRAGELNTEVDVRALAASVTTTMAGMMVMGKAGISKSAMKNVINTTCRLLEG